MKNSTKTTIETYKKIYHEYAERNQINPDVKGFLDRFIKNLQGNKVLDIGCANGVQSNYLAKAGLEVIGIDLTPEFIQLAKKLNSEIDFRVMDMYELAFPEKIFDGLFVNASFLHIPKSNAKKVLSGFARILKANGLLFISVMEGDYDSLRANPTLGWADRHFSDYSEPELIKLLQSVGFKVTKVIRNPTSWGKDWLSMYATLE